MDFEGDNVIVANEQNSEQATERRSLNPNAQPFVPSAASLLASGSTQPNNSTAPIAPPVNSIASSAQPNNPTAESPQQFSGQSMGNRYEQSARSSNTSAPSAPAVETFEDQFRRFLATNAATFGQVCLLSEIKGMLRIDLEPFVPSKPSTDPLNFIRNFERHVEAHKWNYQDTRYQFGNHLVGQANKWFNDQNWRNQDWVQIRTKFLSRFSSQRVSTGLDLSALSVCFAIRRSSAAFKICVFAIFVWMRRRTIKLHWLVRSTRSANWRVWRVWSSFGQNSIGHMRSLRSPCRTCQRILQTSS